MTVYFSLVFEYLVSYPPTGALESWLTGSAPNMDLLLLWSICLEFQHVAHFTWKLLQTLVYQPSVTVVVFLTAKNLPCPNNCYCYAEAQHTVAHIFFTSYIYIYICIYRVFPPLYLWQIIVCGNPGREVIQELGLVISPGVKVPRLHFSLELVRATRRGKKTVC